jgi:hypothetical protein
VAADLAFIGGSLLDFGSQNLIETAACGTPILIGPSTRNFAEAARAALACGAARAVVDAGDLARQVAALLADEAARAAMGEAGKASPRAIAAPRHEPWSCLVEQRVDRSHVLFAQCAGRRLQLEQGAERIEPGLGQFLARIEKLALGVQHVDVDAHADFIAELV